MMGLWGRRLCSWLALACSPATAGCSGPPHAGHCGMHDGGLDASGGCRPAAESKGHRSCSRAQHQAHCPAQPRPIKPINTPAFCPAPHQTLPTHLPLSPQPLLQPRHLAQRLRPRQGLCRGLCLHQHARGDERPPVGGAALPLPAAGRGVGRRGGLWRGRGGVL